MKAYVVRVENLSTGHRKVSQEAYNTILQAQAFCAARSANVKKHNDYLFYDGIYRYEIVEVKIV